MEFKSFDVKLYFTKNYGMGSKPTADNLKTSRVVIGAVLIAVGIIAGIVIRVYNQIIGFVLLFACVGAGLGVMLPPLISHKNTQGKVDDWQAEFDHRKNTWDAEFDKFYQDTVQSMNIKQVAMDKFGIGEESLAELSPLVVHNWVIDGNGNWYRTDKDGKVRADYNRVTLLLFGEYEVYAYEVDFRLTTGSSVSCTKEFFYTDIVSTGVCTWTKAANRRNCIERIAGASLRAEKLTITVPDDNVEVVFSAADNVTPTITAMRALIRAAKVGNLQGKVTKRMAK